MPSINKVDWREAFNNNNGKTSGNKLIGITTTFVCLFIFVACTVFFFIEPEQGDLVLQLIDKDLYFYITGCGTMGVKTIAASIGGDRIDTRGHNPNNNKKENYHEKNRYRRYGQSNEEQSDEETVEQEL